jgi:hypothetical protein
VNTSVSSEASVVTQHQLSRRGTLRRVVRRWERPRPSPRTRDRAGNTANPKAGCRVQQTCRAPRGANRWSREERHERNMSEGGTSGRWRVFGPAGSGHAALIRRRGGSLMNPKRGVQPTRTGVISSISVQQTTRVTVDGPREPLRVFTGEVRQSPVPYPERQRRSGKGQTIHQARGVDDDTP